MILAQGKSRSVAIHHRVKAAGSRAVAWPREQELLLIRAPFTLTISGMMHAPEEQE
jgi:hypothetical protein